MVLATNWTNVFIMTGIGIGIVFVILVLLVFTLQLFNYVATRSSKAPAAAEAAPARTAESGGSLDHVAVAMALNLYFNEVHDEESYRLTIHHNEHSAWNSEINNINNLVK